MIQLNSQRLKPHREIFRSALYCLPIYLALETLGRLIEATFEPAAARFGSSSGNGEDSLALLAAFVMVTTVWTVLSGAIRLLAAKEAITDATIGAIADTNSGALQSPKSPLSRLRRVNLLMIESTRAMASVMLRIPLLILPAVLQWIRLAPMPYLMLLNPDYEAGKIDALKLSTEFSSRKKLLTVFVATLPILILIPEYFLTTDDSILSTLRSNPIQHIGSIVAMSVIKFAFDVFALILVSRKLTPLK